MRIGIEGSPLTIPFHCGVKRYAQELLRHLSQIDESNTYIIFSSKRMGVPRQKNFRYVRIPHLPIMKKQLCLPFLLKRENVDILHCLDPYGSIFLSGPKIITTVHDLDLEQTYPFVSKQVLKRVYCDFTRRMILKKSQVVITYSRFIEKEVKKLRSEMKTWVIGGAAGKEFRKIGRKKGIPEHYLAMGDFAKRKNISNVIEAYSKLPKEVSSKHKLVIVASTIQSKNSFNRIISRSNLQPYVQVMTAISIKELVELYNNVLCFLYPSLYEGFGLPILEAMACGCPVVSSNIGAMKETAGDAALLVNPNSVESISIAMNKIATSKILRDTLVRNGLKRAKEFSWKKTAEDTLKVYESVYASSR